MSNITKLKPYMKCAPTFDNINKVLISKFFI